MRNDFRRRTAAFALAALCSLAVACDLPPFVDVTPVVPPVPTRVVTKAATIGAKLECGGSMTCSPGTALVGERDGTGCDVQSYGLCSTVQTVTAKGDLFAGVHHANCTPLPYFGCGQRAQCGEGKVLVGYSDGTGCGIPNSGQCCELFTDVGNRQVVPSGCSIGSPIGCGGSSQCAGGQVMTGRVDGSGCGVLNQIICCGLAIK